MPVLPSRSQRSQYGSVNLAPRVGRRPPPPPVVLQRGPAQGLEQTKDRQIARIQQSVLQATQQAKSNPLGACNILEGLSLTTGANVVGHGLPQAWRGALLTTPSAAVSWFVGGHDKLDTVQLTVYVSADVTCSLLVW